MSGAVELRDHAKQFNWRTHNEFRGDTFIHAGNVIEVRYRKDGTVEEAKRYTFAKIDDLHLQETTGPRYKKSTVVSWLVNFGS